MDLSYRPARNEDFDFLFQLHKAAMKVYVEDTFGPWDEEWQVAYFRKHFNPAALQIIQLDGKDVGLLSVQERAEELFIVYLAVLPAYQRRGVGTAVIRELIATAGRQGRPVALQVLKANIGARNLYQRLGFGITGENKTHYIMAHDQK